MVEAASAAVAEEVGHDDLCPICQLLLFNPVRTECNHLLCASCMAQWATASSTTNIEHSSLDVNLADFDPSYDPAYLEANCPMCRTYTTASPDKALSRQLQKKYPVAHAERKVEEEVERGSRVGEGGVEGVMILIGNKHRLERGMEDGDECQHDWTFFVRTSRPDLVKEVRIHLHPTFRPPNLTLRNPPYEVRRLGWGWFTIEAEIELNEPYGWVIDNSGTRQSTLELTWTLDFEGRGRQGRVRAKVKKCQVDLSARAARTARVVRPPPVREPEAAEEEDDDDDDEDDDYEVDGGGSSSQDDGDDEDASEYMASPRRQPD